MQLKIKSVKNGKLLLGSILVIIVVGGALLVYSVIEQSPPKQSSVIENYYLRIMKNLNTEENKTTVRSWFERDYNYTELLEWVNYTFVLDKTYNDPERPWITDPSKIKEIGMG